MTDTYTVTSGGPIGPPPGAAEQALQRVRNHPAHVAWRDLEELPRFYDAGRYFQHTSTGVEYVVEHQTNYVTGRDEERLIDHDTVVTVTPGRRVLFLREVDSRHTLDNRRRAHDLAVQQRDAVRARRVAELRASAAPVTFAEARQSGHDFTLREAARVIVDAGGRIERHAGGIVVHIPRPKRAVLVVAAAHLYAAEAHVLAAFKRGKLVELPEQHITPNGTLIR